jgi:MazG family protein
MKNAFQNLIDIAKKLRSPTGCPWDREQTIESMLKCLKEESIEVEEAIEKGDHENLREELGDLLFQIVMICQIASEKGLFTMKEVMEDIVKKLIERHSWVFGTDKVANTEEAIAQWKKNKAKKK